MSNEPMESVSIVFRTPSGAETRRHKRILSGVPKSEVAEMVRDFALYQGLKSDTSPHQLYRYKDSGGSERLVALDFTEVVNLSVG